MNFDSNACPWINGTIRNRKTGAELHGKRRARLNSSAVFSFRIDGTSQSNSFDSDEWVFTPDPEPLKDGYYLLNGFIYRSLNEHVTYAQMSRVGGIIVGGEGLAEYLRDSDAVFLGDLEGNR